MSTIKVLIEYNIQLLKSDIDTNDECLDYLHFGKDFRYTLKNDGCLISETMDRKNEVEEGCKKIFVDKPDTAREIVDKLSQILINSSSNYIS
jgi:hypothetical protein